MSSVQVYGKFNAATTVELVRIKNHRLKVHDAEFIE